MASRQKVLRVTQYQAAKASGRIPDAKPKTNWAPPDECPQQVYSKEMTPKESATVLGIFVDSSPILKTLIQVDPHFDTNKCDHGFETLFEPKGPIRRYRKKTEKWPKCEALPIDGERPRPIGVLAPSSALASYGGKSTQRKDFTSNA